MGEGVGKPIGKDQVAIKEENVGNQLSYSFCFSDLGYGFPDFN